MGAFVATLAWACLGLGLDVGVAAADSSDLDVEAGQGQLGGQLGLYAADNGADATRVSTLSLHGHYGLDPDWSLGLESGAVWLTTRSDGGDSQGVFRLANQRGWLFRSFELTGRGARLRLGLGGTNPVAIAERGTGARLQRAAYDRAAAMGGLRRLSLWAPNRASVLLAIQLRELRKGKLRADLGIIPELSWVVHGRIAGDPWVHVLAPFVARLSLERWALRPGFRVALAWMPTADLGTSQLSFEPELALQLQRLRFELRFLLNLGEPLAGERGEGVWGLRLGVGASL
ncbi:MAG: hypothetical protein OEZ06_03070 [Myxococcales bacterium]|nr:hypothetical protein [Myxococcales bacterium]